MARHVRKGKNPGPVDAWLDTLGFYRKNVAYDETCLFRAVSEQLFSCQIHHERCRKELIEYGKDNCDQFSQLMSREKFLGRLSQLEVHMVICGNFELQIISKKYKKDVLVFNGNTKQVTKITPSHYEETLMLCLMGDDHYDAVYRKDYIQTAGFCQSIVYGLVYENVFNIRNVPKIVHTMLYEKTTLVVVNSEFQGEKDENEGFDGNEPTGNKHSLDDYENMLQMNVAPFSFKVAKALDENIYRNIEYDTWTEIRKELRLGQWYYGDNNLILGTCCLLTTNEGTLQCYIQDINRVRDECVVYITSLAEKRTVKYSSLAPEADAKPWPLPYRFARNTNAVESPSQVKPGDVNNNVDRSKHTLRRRRDNKRNQRCSSTDSVPALMLPVKADVVNNNSVKDFEGSPLRMQQPTQSYEPDTTQAIVDQQNIDYSVEYLAETVSKEVTQDEIYPDTQSTSLFTQHTQPWALATDPQQEHVLQSPQEMLVSSNPFPYYYEQLHQSPLVPITPLPPTSPYYPAIYPSVAPVTPIIYTPTHETQDVFIFSPPTVETYAGVYSPGYNPPIDMSFMSPPFVYPSTPPAWYRSPPVDAQGFIFPTPIVPQK